MVRQEILIYLVISISFPVTFLLMFFSLYLSAGGLVQFETYLVSLIYAIFWSLLFATLLKMRPIKFTVRLESRSVKKILGELKIVVPWALLLSSILIHSSLSRPAPQILDFIFLASVSFWAGVILVDLESVITGCLIALGLCVLLILFALSLPAFLGVLSRLGLDEIVYNQAIKMAFTAIFPFSAIICIASAILGGCFGEKIFASV